MAAYSGEERERVFSGKSMLDLMAIPSRWTRSHTKTKWGAAPNYSRFLTAAVLVQQCYNIDHIAAAIFSINGLTYGERSAVLSSSPRFCIYTTNIVQAIERHYRELEVDGSWRVILLQLR